METGNNSRPKLKTVVTEPAASAADEHAARSHGSQTAHESAEKTGGDGDV